MLLKILMSLILIYTTISIIYTISVKIRHTYKKVNSAVIQIRKKINSPSNKNKSNNLNKFTFTKVLKDLFPDILLIRTKESRDIIILSFSLSFILIIVGTPLENKLPHSIQLGIAVLFLIGLAKYFLYSPNDILGKFHNLAIKWCVLTVFILSLLQLNFSSSIEINKIVFTILFSIVFSLILISSVLKDFHNRWIQVLNIFLGFALILFVVGISFGTFYLEKNSIFNLFTETEYNKYMYDFEMNSTLIFLLIYKGLIYFYSFPNQVNLDEPLTLLLFFEFMLGFIFNVIVIGFLISYFVSALSNNNNNNE